MMGMERKWAISRVLRKLARAVKPCTAAERARRQLLALQLSERDLAIDCGAHVGEVTQLLCRSGAQVYAFEPNPDAFKVLENRFRSHGNVHCIQKAVLDRAGILPLYLHERCLLDPVMWATASSLLEFKPNVRKDSTVLVDVIDLSAFIRSLGRKVNVLKLDVEGVECRILKRLISDGSIDLVENIFVEIHDDKIPQLHEETKELREIIRDKGLNRINLDWV